MSVFTDEEREYLASGVRLGRLATVGPDAMPHVVPTAFRYNQDHDTIDIGGHDFPTRKKYRDVLRNSKVAFVIDDIASVSPWRVRGIEVRGDVEVLDTGGIELGRGFAPEMFRITPQRIVSWGLGEPMSFNAGADPSRQAAAGSRRPRLEPRRLPKRTFRNWDHGDRAVAAQGRRL